MSKTAAINPVSIEIPVPSDAEADPSTMSPSRAPIRRTFNARKADAGINVAHVTGSEVVFENLVYEVPVRVKKQKGFKRVLHELCGVIRPGTVCAIMGPSGGGKTTLLNALAGRTESGNLSGNIFVDGYPRPKKFNRMSGYVVQEDLLPGTLTVRENLMFSAQLRLPQRMSLEEKRARVEETIDLLGLRKCADSKVGTEFIRGISGGEKRRTMIGMELIIAPRVLFLDEPTTGLDSTTAAQVVELLQELARKGRTIIMSIHQPRFRIFKHIDQLILLADGKMVYNGNTMAAVPYFRDVLGFECEAFNNPPDFFLDVILMNDGDSAREHEVIEALEHEHEHKPENGTDHGREMKEIISATTANHSAATAATASSTSAVNHHPESDDEKNTQPHPSTVDDTTTTLRKRSNSITKAAAAAAAASSFPDGPGVSDSVAVDVTPQSRSEHIEFLSQSYLQSAQHTANLDAIAELPCKRGIERLHADEPVVEACSWWNEFRVLSGRMIKTVVRNPAASVLQFVALIVVGLFIGIVYLNIPDSQSGITDRTGAVFFLLMQLVFSNLSAIEILLKEKPIFIHEKSSGYYRTSTYFLSKCAYDLIPLRVLPIIPFTCISYWMMHFQLDAGRFFKVMLCEILTSLMASSYCFLISSTISVFAVANLAVALTYVIYMLFGGLFINIANVPGVFRWISHISIFNYPYESIIVTELSGRQFTCLPNELGPGGLCPFPDGDTWLATRGFEVSDFWGNVGVMISMTAIYLFLAFLRLRSLKNNKA